MYLKMKTPITTSNWPRLTYIHYMSIRVASYNIRKCIGLDRKREPGRIADVLNGLGADVIALQEADRRMGARPAALPRALIENETDFQIAPLAEGDDSLGWHGNALLLRDGVHIGGTARIELPGLEPRGAVLAEIHGDRGSLRIVGVHLGLMRRHRQRQLDTIRTALAAREDMATVVLGDFNEWSADRGLEALGTSMEVHAPGHSFHAARPIAALDRIALSRELTLEDAGVVETSLSRRASDHLPIWADISQPAPGPAPSKRAVSWILR